MVDGFVLLKYSLETYPSTPLAFILLHPLLVEYTVTAVPFDNDKIIVPYARILIRRKRNEN